MSKKKVMVIDDEKDLLQLTTMTLQQSGRFDVLPLMDANDIIEQVHEFKPDIILLDIRMPGVSGLEACQMLNEDPLGKETPIIILSVLKEDQDKLKAFKVGVVDYLTKSAGKEELFAKIDKALQYR